MDPAELAFARLVVWMLVCGWTGGSSVRIDRAGNVQTVSWCRCVVIVRLDHTVSLKELDHTVSLKDAMSAVAAV